MVWISRVPPPQLAAFKQRMGWTLNWLSSENVFNDDYGVCFMLEQLEEAATTISGTMPLGASKRPQSAG